MNKIARTLKKRKDYLASIEEGLASGDIAAEDLIFIDEAGSKLGMSSNYARAENGERAVCKEPKNKGKNISIVGAIAITGVVAMMYCLSTMNACGFQNFIENYLVPNLEPGKIVIMDNINFHLSKRVEDLIESAGARVVFLPPYSPELNPIENLWSKLKSYLRKKMPITLSDYHKSLLEALETVTSCDCEGWFENCHAC